MMKAEWVSAICPTCNGWRIISRIERMDSDTVKDLRKARKDGCSIIYTDVMPKSCTNNNECNRFFNSNSESL